MTRFCSNCANTQGAHHHHTATADNGTVLRLQLSHPRSLQQNNRQGSAAPLTLHAQHGWKLLSLRLDCDKPQLRRKKQKIQLYYTDPGRARLQCQHSSQAQLQTFLQIPTQPALPNKLWGLPETTSLETPNPAADNCQRYCCWVLRYLPSRKKQHRHVCAVRCTA